MSLTQPQVELIDTLIDIKLRIMMAQAIIANDPNATEQGTVAMVQPLYVKLEVIKKRLSEV